MILDLLYVTPHSAAVPGLPSRPRALLDALIATGAFRTIQVVNRVRPQEIGDLRRGLPRIDLTRHTAGADGLDVTRHPWPFGPLEVRFLTTTLDRFASRHHDGVVAWVADPKSARFFEGIPHHRGLVTIFDAYDAWDLSPLVVGRRRAEAVRRGYRAAARHGDVVFANTTSMVERMRLLGARNVQRLPNAAPTIPVDDAAVPTGDYLLYLGRIHERVDVDLLCAVVDAYPNVPIRIVGPVERRPARWADFVARPSVHQGPAVPGAEALRLIASARALLLPHVVDDYTRSQDSMKAWDALATGTPVVGTALPPLTDWPAGTAVIAEDRDAFVNGVGLVLEGRMAAGRDDRLRLARSETWAARATTAVDAIREVASS